MGQIEFLYVSEVTEISNFDLSQNEGSGARAGSLTVEVGPPSSKSRLLTEG